MSGYALIVSASDRPQWLEARKTGVGASESPILTGASRWGSPVSLWGIKTGRLPDEDTENERMLWGQRLEPLVAEEYERKTGRELAPWGWLLRSTTAPFMLATPDYRTEDGWPVEIKTTDASRIKDWKDGAPPHVVVQCQHQMFVTGTSKASVGVLVGGNRFMWTDVERDEAVIREVLAACGTFWEHVTKNLPPPADASDATSEAIALLWPHTAEGESLVLPEDAYGWVRELDKAKGEAKAVDYQITEIENKVKLAMGAAELALLPDGSRAFTLRTRNRKAYSVPAGSSRVLRRVE